MTEKEFYNARAEGYRMIENIHSELSDSEFMEFMNLVREVAVQYKSSVTDVEKEILDKCEIIKKIKQLFYR